MREWGHKQWNNIQTQEGASIKKKTPMRVQDPTYVALWELCPWTHSLTRERDPLSLCVEEVARSKKLAHLQRGRLEEKQAKLGSNRERERERERERFIASGLASLEALHAHIRSRE